MTKDEFIFEISKLGIELTNEQIKKLETYKEFLKEYNKHTNLTAIKEDKDIYLKHFYDSLTIVKVINLNLVNNLLDVGTGAGFPGMVLKIVYPNLNVTLLDSNNKKTKFLTELKEKLQMDVEIINDRVENYAKNNLNKFDVVTSRAVANLRVLSELCLPLVKIDGLFIPLKGKVKEELQESLSTLDVMHAKILNKQEFMIENAGIRNILVIQKLIVSTQEDLRSYDKILKKPLQKSVK